LDLGHRRRGRPTGRTGEVADEGGHRIEPEFEAPAEPAPRRIAPETWLDPEVDADESLQAEQARRFRAAARVAALIPMTAFRCEGAMKVQTKVFLARDLSLALDAAARRKRIEVRDRAGGGRQLSVAR
jgi:hypothetical protein